VHHHGAYVGSAATTAGDLWQLLRSQRPKDVRGTCL
jgi:hypothetical protein